MFANSVLGARTDRYGDFIDICCAITGRRRPPACTWMKGGPRARIFRLEGIPDRLLADPIAHAAVGRGGGARHRHDGSGDRLGLPPAPITTEDHADALGAVPHRPGRSPLFHAVVTPEAPTLEAAHGRLAAAAGAHHHGRTTCGRRAMRPRPLPVGAAIGAVSIGTPALPHCASSPSSLRWSSGRRMAVPFFVNTGRDVTRPSRARGTASVVAAAGITVQ